MRKKNVIFLLCLVLALLLLSLPRKTNNLLQSTCSLWLCTLFSSNSDTPPENDFSAINYHLAENETELLAAQHNASKIAPQHSSYMVAKVIYRTQSSWNSCLWVDVGSDDNPDSSRAIIAKNSPVLSGDCVVGIIDYVGKKASLVRLISDSNLTPAVRVARNLQDKELLWASHKVQHTARTTLSIEENKTLNALINKLTGDQELPQFLAKGILVGNNEPVWRRNSTSLRGIGFTCDFPDHYGPARDLRTGEAVSNNTFPHAIKTAIVLQGDLLVTSGMDGLFPEGLKVAKVSTIYPLQEGAFSYELEAIACAHDLGELTYLTILQPQNFSLQDPPSRLALIKEQIDN